MEDILEEIVGEFTTDYSASSSSDILDQEDGSYLIDGTATIRHINKNLKWALPADGPKTLNGLITEALETLPETQVCVAIGQYQVEIKQVKDNMIKTAKVRRLQKPED
jgi:Mg2+/Co2+ transporter CorB